MKIISPIVKCVDIFKAAKTLKEFWHMTDYDLNVPSQKFPVPKITKQTKSHSLNFNVLSSAIDSSGEEVWVSFDSDNYFYVKTWFE